MRIRLLLLQVIVRDLAANIGLDVSIHNTLQEKASFAWRGGKETTRLDDSPHEMGEQQEQGLVGKGMMTTAAQHQIKKKI